MAASFRTLDPMQTVANYIMPNRVPASNFVRDTVEITPIERYIRQKRREGLTGFGITHVFLAAYVRCVAKYPAVNRFLSGQQVYSRDDDIQFCMVVKTEMATDASESIAKIHLKPTDTANDVYEKLNKAVSDIQGHALGSDFDKTAKVLSLIPGVLFKFTVWLLKLIDYFGLLPKFLLEVSPFHGSIFFTSMGSLGDPADRPPSLRLRQPAGLHRLRLQIPEERDSGRRHRHLEEVRGLYRQHR